MVMTGKSIACGVSGVSECWGYSLLANTSIRQPVHVVHSIAGVTPQAKCPVNTRIRKTHTPQIVPKMYRTSGQTKAVCRAVAFFEQKKKVTISILVGSRDSDILMGQPWEFSGIQHQQRGWSTCLGVSWCGERGDPQDVPQTLGDGRLGQVSWPSLG